MSNGDWREFTPDEVYEVFKSTIISTENHFQRKSDKRFVILVNRALFDEAIVRSERVDLQKIRAFDNVPKPNCIKRAASYIHWIVKLKPFRVLDVTEVTLIMEALKHDCDMTEELSKLPAKAGADTRFINELIAVLAGFGLAENKNAKCPDDEKYEIDPSPAMIQDLMTGLRYNLYSQSAIASIIKSSARPAE